MDHTNLWYGHAHAFAEYCGLDSAAPPPIRGVIQHGWTFVHGLGYGHYNDPSFTKLVWSEISRRRGQVIGWRDFVVTGAPFAYLDRVRPREDVERTGTIWYPFHGTKDYETVSGAHDELVREIQRTEDGPVTVCLYYVEYDDPTIRQYYRDAGFRVICHGRRGAQWKGADRYFLARQLAELRRHRRVCSNRLTTAVMYGAAIGCEPGIYGDPMQFVGGKAGFVGDGLLEALYPQFFTPHVEDVAEVREIARAEIGMDRVMGPDELRYLLGWDDPWLPSSN